VSIAGLGFALAFLSTALVALRLRHTRPDLPRPYRMPGGRITAVLAVAGSIFVLFLALYQPWIDSRGAFPLEWTVLLSWTVLGGVFWLLARRVRDQADESERRRLILGEAVVAQTADAAPRSV
jgi:amino acid transporter